MQKPDKEIQPNGFGSSSNTIATRLSRLKAAAAEPLLAVSR
jgi:hypothetical protein